MGPAGKNAQDHPTDSDEPIRLRIGRAPHPIAELKSLQGEHRRVLKVVEALRARRFASRDP